MAKMKKKWLSRALCTALAVTLTAGTAVMTPVADIVGTNITANAANYTTWGTCQWKVENGKLYIKGNIPNTGSLADIPWFADSIRNTITEVYAEEGAKLSADASYLFYNLTKATTMDLSNLDTSAATNMQGMFYNCKPASLDLSSFDTSKVTDMSYMFYGCTNLTSLNLDGWNTSSVTIMEDMFQSCNALTSLDLSGWDTKNVTNMNGLFTYCSKLTSLKLDGWNTSSVTTMNSMFYGCYNLTPLDVSGWDTKNVTAMKCTFYGCNNLTSLDVSGWDTKNVTSMYGMFYGCKNLTSLDLSSFDTSKVTSMNSMFYGCNNLTSLDLSSWNTSSVTTMESMFSSCGSLKTVYVGDDWSTSAVTNSAKMFYNCYDITGGNGTTYTGNNPKDKTYARIDSSSAPGYLTQSPIIAQGSYWRITDEDFDGNYKLVLFGTIPNTGGGSFTPPWNSYRNKITEVTTENGAKASADASYLFAYLRNATSIDLSHLDTSAATSMKYMFYNCQKLTSLDLSGWDTSKVENMEAMFKDCWGLTSLDLSGWKVSNVTSMNSMFYCCATLTSLNLSSWDTSNVTNMERMFAFCSNLTSLDLIGWDTSNVTNMYTMFDSCSKLTTITVGKNWNTDKARKSDYMFSGCTSLVGSKGTTYDRTKVDDTYARIDGGANAPGYFTDGTIIAQGDYWRITDEDFDGNYKLTIFGTIPNTGGSTTNIPWYNSYRNKITEVTTEDGAKTSANASYLFSSLTNATSIDLSHLDTSAVTSMEGMFFSCSSLTSIDVSSFDTSNVKNFYVMFLNCKNLVSVNVDGLVTSSATNIEGVFNSCSKLTEVDLSTWDTSGVTNAQGVFYYCESLKTIYVGNGWDLSNVTSDTNYMFKGCTALVGGKGTKFADAQVTDKTYARIDGGTSNPGYFTQGVVKPKTYTVTWKNYDGTTLETDQNVEEGTTPSYDGATPTKTSTAQYSYTFSGWTPAISAVTEDITYTAVFDSTLNSYTVTWIDGDGIATTDTVEYGTTPTPPHLTKTATEHYSYTFSNWDKEITAVTGDVTYTALFDEFVIIHDDNIFVNSTESTTPEIVVTDPITKKPLTEGTDYTVTINDDSTVTVKGAGSYTGEVQKPFFVLSYELKCFITNRRKIGNNAKTVLTGEWYLPKNATNIKAGIARLSTDDTNITNYDVYTNGVKKASTLKTTSGRFPFCLLLNSTNAKKNLYAVTYVTFELDGQKFASISNIEHSPAPALS